MNDIKRNDLSKLKTLLQHFPVVAVLGARQCGKTTLAKQAMPQWKYVDMENPRDFEQITHDPLFFFQQYPQHVIIDEAQEYPPLFQILRGVIDEQRQQKGRFILTGSSSPELLNHISESLAGRIAIIHLGTLKMNEQYQRPLSQFYQLFASPLTKKNIITSKPPLSLTQVQNHWLKGGYPEPVLQQDQNFYQQWMENYRDTYIHRDIAKLFPRLNKFAYQRFLMMLSKLSGTILNKSEIARALEVSEGTVREYLNIVDGTFLWRQLPSFENNVTKSVIKMPKGHLRDTGLLHYLLKITTMDNLLQDPIVGRSFEAFVIEELLKGLESTLITNWQPYYYRTRAGAEIDLILQGNFGTLPIEVKHGATVRMKQLTALSQFVNDHNLPFAMVINQSEAITWLTSKIVQVPVGWL